VSTAQKAERIKPVHGELRLTHNGGFWKQGHIIIREVTQKPGSEGHHATWREYSGQMVAERNHRESRQLRGHEAWSARRGARVKDKAGDWMWASHAGPCLKGQAIDLGNDLKNNRKATEVF
jgi:hypothetical protein